MKILYKFKQGSYPEGNVEVKCSGKRLYITTLTDYGSHSRWIKLIVKYDAEEGTYTLIDKKDGN